MAVPQRVLDETNGSAQERAAMLKERVYVAFTALAVLIATDGHGHEPTAGGAVFTLVITVAAVLLASFMADVISHSAVHASLLTRDEVRHLLKVVWGAAGAIVGPLILLGLSALEVMSVSMALRMGQWWLIAALAFFAFLATRRMRLGFWRTLVLMLGMAAVGALVIILQILAHS